MSTQPRAFAISLANGSSFYGGHDVYSALSVGYKPCQRLLFVEILVLTETTPAAVCLTIAVRPEKGLITPQN